MASALPELAGGEPHIQRLVQARRLEHQLAWLPLTVIAIPIDLLWAGLAIHAGVPIQWWLPWVIARAGLHVYMVMSVPRWRPFIQDDPAGGLKRVTTWFASYGLLHAALMPFFYVGSSDEIKLLAFALASGTFSGVVLGAAGDQRLFWLTVLPAYAVYVIGWLQRGGWMGWSMVLLLLLSVPVLTRSIREQRRSWEALVRLGTALAAERDRAQAAADARTRFFAAASHDLRQPLHALSINATTLDLLARRAADGRLVEISQGIGRALHQSKGLLDALLDISRLDAGTVRLQSSECDLASLLAGLHQEFSATALQRGLDFALDLPPQALWARTDAEQLLRIVRNLLDNAFKFTDRGGVRLSARRVTAGPAGPQLRITVADTGRGIAFEDRERVFEEFFQIGNPTRDRARGLGLGLAIVRRTAALLDIHVALHPREPGPGSVFELTLPALADPPGVFDAGTVEPRVAPSSLATAALTVLLVDDEADILQALCTLLAAHGWTPLATGSVEDALAAAGDRGVSIDVAVIDHRLPGGDGIGLVHRLRERHPNLPALIVTGDMAVQWQVRRQGLPVLHKPLDGDMLVAAIAAEASAAVRWSARHEAFETLTGEPAMNLIDALHGRRSVRSYTREAVPRALIEDLIWHASQIPRPPLSDETSWSFVVVDGAARLADFGRRAKQYAADHQPPGNPWTWAERSDFEVFWGAPMAVLVCARRGHPEAAFDCCRAGQNLGLLAHAAGLGSCWLGSALPWLNGPEGRTEANIPQGYDVSVAMAIGRAAEAMPGRASPAPQIAWCA